LPAGERQAETKSACSRRAFIISIPHFAPPYRYFMCWSEIEVSRKFPTPNVLEQLAGALNIKTYQLFFMLPSPDDVMERLYQTVAKKH
jgi:hypothetical protein